MLVLLSFGLVLVATVLLVLGLLSDDGLQLIYLSIASSVAAAVVLVVALKLNKPREQARATAPAPLPDLEPEPQPQPAMAGATTSTSASRSSDEWLAADQHTWSAGDADDWQEGDEVEFPIADYDTLSSSQILPLLPQLYADEIPVVEQRERSTKARPEILDKLAELQGAEAEPTALAPATPVTDDPLASYTESAPTASATWGDDDWFPIEDYESLSAAQIRPLLPELDAEELVMVRDKESALGRRRSLLDEIDRLLAPGSAPSVARPPAVALAQRAASKQAAVPAKKKAAAPARKAPAKKATAPTRKRAAPAAKSTKVTSSTKQAAIKKATAKKAATKKGAAPKTATAKRATPARRSTKR